MHKGEYVERLGTTELLRVKARCLHVAASLAVLGTQAATDAMHITLYHNLLPVVAHLDDT